MIACSVACTIASFVVSGNTTTAPSLPQTSAAGHGIAAMDAVIAFHLGHLENVSRIIDVPDMRNETTNTFLFVRVKRVMVATNVRLRLPTELERVSSVSVETNASECNFTFDMALGNMTSWGKYDVKVRWHSQKTKRDIQI